MAVNFCTFGKNSVNQLFNYKHCFFIVQSMVQKKAKSAVGIYKSKVGLPPGTLTYHNPPGAPDTILTLTSYNAQACEVTPIDAAGIRSAIQQEDRVCWISVIGYRNTSVIDEIGRQFGLHMLTMEDILNTDHLPKAEVFDDKLFLTMKMFNIHAPAKNMEEEHASFVLGSHFLITFQERGGDDFQVIRDRIQAGHGKVRTKGSDYLFYLLIDRIVDNYYLALDAFEEVMDTIEEELVHHPQPMLAEKILQHKKQLTHLRKFILPLRDEFGRILRGDIPLISKPSLAYFRDVYDHLIHLSNTVDNYKETMIGLMELHFSKNTDRINNVMKTLTMIATIFIPLTFLAGVWGMNFQFMPELQYPWAYPAALGLMVIIGVSMYIYMKRKRWL